MNEKMLKSLFMYNRTSKIIKLLLENKNKWSENDIRCVFTLSIKNKNFMVTHFITQIYNTYLNTKLEFTYKNYNNSIKSDEYSYYLSRIKVNNSFPVIISDNFDIVRHLIFNKIISKQIKSAHSNINHILPLIENKVCSEILKYMLTTEMLTYFNNHLYNYRDPKYYELPIERYYGLNYSRRKYKKIYTNTNYNKNLTNKRIIMLSN